MKRTPLHAEHVTAGATMVDYAGWDMPVSYAGTVMEVNAVRQSAGIFDVSHMGEIRIIGRESLDYLQYITANDVSRLAVGDAQYSLLLNDDGGVVDDIIVYRHGTEDFLIVVNAGCADKDWDWFVKHSAGYEDLTVADESEATALIAAQGPKAVDLAVSVFGEGVRDLKRFQFIPDSFGDDPVTVSRTGYTGEDGVEIFCGIHTAPSIWDALHAGGAVPSGLGARDVLRLEAGYPLYGHELDADHSPYESGVGWAVKLKKPDFVGREAVIRRKAEGSARLTGLTMLDRAIPRADCPVLDPRSGEPIGIVLSGTFSPTLQQGIATTRLSPPQSDPGVQVLIDIRGRRMAAQTVALPFYRNGV